LVALIRLHDLAGIQLLVGVGWVDDELLGVVDDRERGEAIASTELTRPASANRVTTADIAGRIGLARRGTFDLERASSCWCGVGVDGETPCAGSRGTDSLPVKRK
jgi:hypothetical protein